MRLYPLHFLLLISSYYSGYLAVSCYYLTPLLKFGQLSLLLLHMTTSLLAVDLVA